MLGHTYCLLHIITNLDYKLHGVPFDIANSILETAKGLLKTNISV